jgi:hypothetical protein
MILLFITIVMNNTDRIKRIVCGKVTITRAAKKEEKKNSLCTIQTAPTDQNVRSPRVRPQPQCEGPCDRGTSGDVTEPMRPDGNARNHYSQTPAERRSPDHPAFNR